MTARVVCGLTGLAETVFERSARWFCSGCGRPVRRPVMWANLIREGLG